MHVVLMNGNRGMDSSAATSASAAAAILDATSMKMNYVFDDKCDDALNYNHAWLDLPLHLEVLLQFWRLRV